MTHLDKPNWARPLLTMIEASHSREAMKQVRDYSPDPQARTMFKDLCQDMLEKTFPEGSSCVLMSALLATSLEQSLGITIPVIAGALKLNGDYMYGSNSAIYGAQIFSKNNNVSHFC